MYEEMRKREQDDTGGTVRKVKKKSLQGKSDYKNPRIQLKRNNYGSKEIVQCSDWQSRTLEHEADEIKDEVKERIRKLEIDMSMVEVESQFDDELYNLYMKKEKINMVHQTLHHILPRNAIDQFIQNLNDEKKREILLKFVRYADNDVTKEEYEHIKNGNNTKFLNSILKRTLMSLRSNLTFGPTKRSDDPKGKQNDFDPNYVLGKNGELDEISKLYEEAYKRIKELQNMEGTEKNESIQFIVDKLVEAESKLAQKQGLTGEDAYRHTKLEVGNPDNWELFPAEGNPRKVK